jgi:NAD(P)-dependent dehydrogenase (short-subunit alcohol dehydrogenase family)
MSAKTVIVTGASSGIGLGIAKAYLALGYNVVANSRKIENLKIAARELGDPKNLLLVAGDIGLKETAQNVVDQAIRHFGKIDILINNAGIFQSKSFTDYTVEDLGAQVSTNLNGFFYLHNLLFKICCSVRKVTL